MEFKKQILEVHGYSLKYSQVQQLFSQNMTMCRLRNTDRGLKLFSMLLCSLLVGFFFPLLNAMEESASKTSTSSTAVNSNGPTVPRLYSSVLKRPSIRTVLGLENEPTHSENPAKDVAALRHAKEEALCLESLPKNFPQSPTKQYANVPVVLLEYDDFSKKPVDTFLHPEFMEIEEYKEFWADVLILSEQCFSASVTSIVLEYESFIYLAVENHTMFYFTSCKAQAVRTKIDAILLDAFATFKTIEAGFPVYLIPSAKTYNLFLQYGLKTLRIAIGIIDNSFDTPFSQRLLEVVRPLEKQASINGINKLESALEDFIKFQLSKPVPLRKRGNQFTLLVEETIKLGFAFISLVRKYLRDQGLTVLTNDDPVLQMTFNHFYKYSLHLQKSDQIQRTLSLPEIVQIMNLTSPFDIFDATKGKVPKCSYFCRYLLEIIKMFTPAASQAIREALMSEEQTRAQSLEELIEAEVEEALRKRTARPIKSSKKRGKARKRPVKKQAIASRSPNDDAPTNKPTAAPSQVKEPVDDRERQFAIIVVGEYLTTRILHPVMISLGQNPESWSWNRLISEIESNLSTHLSSRKNFLKKSIEWVRRRNAIAHPVIDGFSDTSFLWNDLELLKESLGTKRAAMIDEFLTSLKVPKPEGKGKPLSPFGRSDLGITSEVIGKTISAMRLCQTVLDKTVSPACQENQVEPTLPRLKEWRTCLPFLAEIAWLSDDLMDAVVGLLGIRNEFAHPAVSAQMVRTLIASNLKDDPDYEVFLSRLAKHNN